MAENVKCKSCKRLKNHWCKAVLDSPDEDMLRDCCHFLQKTKADRIRAMSDEELADWLARTQIDNVAEALEIAKIPMVRTRRLKDEVKRECLEWLQQPAEVDNG